MVQIKKILRKIVSIKKLLPVKRILISTAVLLFLLKVGKTETRVLPSVKQQYHIVKVNDCVKYLPELYDNLDIEEIFLVASGDAPISPGSTSRRPNFAPSNNSPAKPSSAQAPTPFPSSRTYNRQPRIPHSVVKQPPGVPAAAARPIKNKLNANKSSNDQNNIPKSNKQTKNESGKGQPDKNQPDEENSVSKEGKKTKSDSDFKQYDPGPKKKKNLEQCDLTETVTVTEKFASPGLARVSEKSLNDLNVFVEYYRLKGRLSEGIGPMDINTKNVNLGNKRFLIKGKYGRYLVEVGKTNEVMILAVGNRRDMQKMRALAYNDLNVNLFY